MKKESGRFWVPNWVVDGSLSGMGSEVKTLLTLARFANREGLAWPSVLTISKCAGVDERTVRRHLRLLQKQGLISKVSAGRGGRGVSTKYRLTAASWLSFQGATQGIQTRTPVSGFSCGEGVDNSGEEPGNPDRTQPKPGQTEDQRGTELSGEGSEKESLKVYGLEKLGDVIGNGNDNDASKGAMTEQDADHRRRQMLRDLADHQAQEKALATA